MFFAAALMTSGLVAQDLKFGALAGLNVNIITENVDPEPDGYESSTASGFGFHLGGFGEYAINESIGIRAELQIQQRGVTDEIEFVTIDENLELTTAMVDYKQSDLFVQIPILVAINAGESLSFHVGPTLGFLASANAEFDGEEVENADEGRNGFELGLALGAQYNLNENMGIGLRYTRGLTDLAEDNEFGGTTLNNNYNVIQAYFSYAFGG